MLKIIRVQLVSIILFKISPIDVILFYFFVYFFFVTTEFLNTFGRLFYNKSIG